MRTKTWKVNELRPEKNQTKTGIIRVKAPLKTPQISEKEGAGAGFEPHALWRYLPKLSSLLL